MSKRVIVTGATGFIGRLTIPLLLSLGYEVHVLTNKNEIGPVTGELHSHQLDIFDYKEVRRICRELQVENLLHLAWHGGVKNRMTSPENLSWVEASINLVRSFSENGGTRMVLAGSCAEYDWRYGYCNERITPTEPASLYGVSKNTLHKLISRFCQDSGIQYSNGRIFFVYGPREAQNRFVASIVKSLLADQEVEVKHPDLIRDYLHATDVANALVTLLDSNLEGAVNIGSGQPTRLRDMARLIGDKLQKSELIALDSAENVPHKSPVVLADATRLQNELGWKPNYNLENGLEATIDWWREQNQIMIND